MYGGVEALCMRNGNALVVNDLPPDITEDDLFSEFCRFGEIVNIEIDPRWGNAAIHFQTLRSAATAEKYCIAGLQTAPPMMPQMSNQMMGVPMMGGHMAGAMYPWAGRPVGYPMNFQQSPTPCNVQISPQRDGSRSVFSPGKGTAMLTEGPAVRQVNKLEDVCALELGPCTLCKKITSYTCGRCGVFYCSRECQTQHWAEHKAKCNSGLPPLNYAGMKDITEIEVHRMVARKDSRNLSESRGIQWRQQSSSHVEQSGRQPPSDKQPLTSKCSENLAEPGGNDFKGQRSPNDRVQSSRYAHGDYSKPREERGQSASSFGQRQGRFGDRQSQNPSMNGEKTGLLGEKPGDMHGFSNGGRSNFGGNQRNWKNSRSAENCDGPKAADTEQPKLTTSESNAACSSGSNGAKASMSPRNSESKPEVKNIPCLTSAGKQESSPSGVMAKLMASLKVKQSEPASSPDLVSPTAQASALSSSEPRLAKPPSIVIASGTKVVVSHVDDHLIYLRPFEPDNLQKLTVLSSKLASHCSTAQRLSRQPKKREFLAAKFSVDKSFYRAVVESKPNKAEDKYTVRFIDFGNPEAGLTNLDMIHLPDDLAEVPCMAVQTFLKLVPEDKPFPPEVSQLLNSLFVQETPLKVEFCNDLSEGVTLLNVKGESVNENILKLMAPAPTPVAPAPTPVAPVPTPVAPAPTPVAPAPVAPAPTPVIPAPVAPVPIPVVPAPVATAPTPVIPAPVATAPTPVIPAPVATAPIPVVPAAAQPPAAPRRLNLDDVKYVEFPPIGTNLKILINHVHNEGFFMACPVDNTDALEKAHTLTASLLTYAETAQPYRPAEYELCVAKWIDDCWYRGVCLEREGDTFSIMFLEYGNVDSVNYPDIRPLTEDLMEVPALSSMCVLNGIVLNDQQKTKLSSMFHENWVVEATVMNIDQGTYSLDIPVIQNNL